MKTLDGPMIAPQSGKAKQMVIFLHGYGSNGEDLISIGEEWAEALPDAVFLSPNAPDMCDQSSMGFQWFAIRAIDKAAFEREKQADQVKPVLDNFIDEQLKEWGVDESQLFVVGFSQGAMMAMYTMPRRQKACGGVLGYSGMLIDAESLKGSGIVKPRILAIHGDRDDIVFPKALADVQTGFAAAGFDIETVMRPGLGHGIDHFGLTRGLEFIQEGIK